MPKLPELVTKKIGPLPLWSYVVIGGVLVFILRKRGAGSSSSGGGIGIPVLTPSGSSSGGTIGAGGNAVGSPGQNVQGGSDTQPGGAPPHWVPPPPPGSVSPPWWGDPIAPWSPPLPPGGKTAVGAGPAATPAAASPGTNPGGATSGVLPAMSVFDRMNLFPSAVPEGGFTPAQQAGLIESAQRLGPIGGTYFGPSDGASNPPVVPQPPVIPQIPMQPLAQGWTPDPSPAAVAPAGYSRLLDASTGTYYVKPFVETPEPQGRWDKSN